MFSLPSFPFLTVFWSGKSCFWAFPVGVSPAVFYSRSVYQSSSLPQCMVVLKVFFLLFLNSFLNATVFPGKTTPHRQRPPKGALTLPCPPLHTFTCTMTLTLHFSVQHNTVLHNLVDASGVLLVRSCRSCVFCVYKLQRERGLFPVYALSCRKDSETRQEDATKIRKKRPC